MLFQSIAMVIRQTFVTYSLPIGNAIDRSLTSFTLIINQQVVLLLVTGTCHNQEIGQSTELEEAKKEKLYYFLKMSKIILNT
jgi:hypothetical protein